MTLILASYALSRIELGDLSSCKRMIMLDLPDLLLFKAIVDARSLSKAATALQSSPPAVSRRLGDLERRLNVRLADRSSRRFMLTQEGEILYAHSCAILDQVRDAEADVASRRQGATGRLRVSAPNELGRRRLAPLIGTFSAAHPGLKTHLSLSDEGIEVGQDNFDVVLRIGLPHEAEPLTRKLAASPCVVCASPAYVSRHGPVERAEDLAERNCLILARRDGLENRWAFLRANGEHQIDVHGTLSSESGEVLHAWALAGLGISREACWDVRDDLHSGNLVDLLPNERLRPIELFATFSPGRPIAPRVRLLVDYLTEELSKVALEQDSI